MAMSKPKEHPSGVTAQYHRIVSISANFNPPPGYVQSGFDCVAQVEIASYLDADARAAGKSPVDKIYKNVGIQGEPTREAVYRFLSRPVEYAQIDVPGMVDGKPGSVPQSIAVSDSITGFNEAEPV